MICFFLLLITAMPLFCADDFFENSIKRTKLSDSVYTNQKGIVIAMRGPAQSLQHIASKSITANIVDSILSNTSSLQEFELLDNYPLDVLMMLKNSLFQHHPQLLELAQKEDLKKICECDHRFEKLQWYKDSLLFIRESHIDVREISGKFSKTFYLRPPIDLYVETELFDDHLYYKTKLNGINKLCLVSGVESPAFAGQQVENAKYFKVLKGNKGLADYCNNESLDAVLIDGDQRRSYHEREFFNSEGSEQYVVLAATFEKKLKQPLELYCIDLESGKEYGPFSHTYDQSYGSIIPPLFFNETTFITILNDTCYLQNILSKQCVNKIKMPGPLFYASFSKGKYQIGMDLLREGLHFVSMNFDDATYQDICKAPSGALSYQVKLSNVADVMYASGKIYSYSGDELIPTTDGARWRFRRNDSYVFKKYTDSTITHYFYETHSKMKEAPLKELLMLLTVSQQSKSSQIDPEMLAPLIKSKNSRIAEIALRYVPQL